MLIFFDEGRKGNFKAGQRIIEDQESDNLDPGGQITFGDGRQYGK